jgi:hypothetical protein
MKSVIEQIRMQAERVKAELAELKATIDDHQAEIDAGMTESWTILLNELAHQLDRLRSHGDDVVVAGPTSALTILNGLQVTLPPGCPSTTDLLREDRDR